MVGSLVHFIPPTVPALVACISRYQVQVAALEKTVIKLSESVEREDCGKEIGRVSPPGDRSPWLLKSITGLESLSSN
jgi:hypothetical protein